MNRPYKYGMLNMVICFRCRLPFLFESIIFPSLTRLPHLVRSRPETADPLPL
nr:hypothetical protein Q903MT_gene2390 [Picea sitchensis]